MCWAWVSKFVSKADALAATPLYAIGKRGDFITKRNIIFFLALGLFVVGCKTSSTSLNYSKVEGELLLSKVRVDGKLFKEFIYDNKSKPIRMNQYSGQNVMTELYFYDTLGRLEKRVQDDFIYTYYYDEKDLLESQIRLSKKSDAVWEIIYEYDSKARIIKAISNMDNRIFSYFKYEYDFTNNTTLRKEYQSSDDQSMRQVVYNYDKFNNPYPINSEIDIVQNNNIKKYSSFSHVMQFSTEYESVFEYNFKKLPTIEFRKSTKQNKVSIFAYDYIPK